jgi:hypothetical protein
MDELDNAYAVSFSCSGDKLITGSNRMIRYLLRNYTYLIYLYALTSFNVCIYLFS